MLRVIFLRACYCRRLLQGGGTCGKQSGGWQRAMSSCRSRMPGPSHRTTSLTKRSQSLLCASIRCGMFHTLAHNLVGYHMLTMGEVTLEDRTCCVL